MKEPAFCFFFCRVLFSLYNMTNVVFLFPLYGWVVALCSLRSFWFLCFMSSVNMTGAYTEDEP